MGSSTKSRIIIVLICFFVAGTVQLWVVGTGQRSASPKKVPLARAFLNIGQWKNVGDITLEKDVIGVLKLDDFLFRKYSNGSDLITLYVGYYYTSKKIGAAHDPLVCFPGQGWVLEHIEQSESLVLCQTGDVNVHYTSMIASRDGADKFLLYWFQAYNHAVPDTFSQKLYLLSSKIIGRGEDNAFVRISIDMQDKTEKEARDIILTFVQEFYPLFWVYVTNTNEW